jgi:hypothetical protein
LPAARRALALAAPLLQALEDQIESECELLFPVWGFGGQVLLPVLG